VQVLGHTCGKWLGVCTLILTVLNLIGNGTAQVCIETLAPDLGSVAFSMLLCLRNCGVSAGSQDALPAPQWFALWRMFSYNLMRPETFVGGADCGRSCQHLLHQPCPVKAVSVLPSGCLLYWGVLLICLTRSLLSSSDVFCTLAHTDCSPSGEAKRCSQNSMQCALSWAFPMLGIHIHCCLSCRQVCPLQIMSQYFALGLCYARRGKAEERSLASGVGLLCGERCHSS